MIQLHVRDYSGSRARLNRSITATPVTLAEVVLKAITVGGIPAGHPWHLALRRGAISSLVQSAIQPRAVTDALVTTPLYDGMETTEKAGTSFRLGMAFAAVVAEKVLGVAAIHHVRPRAGGRGRRADLLGCDPTGDVHVVEAKGRTYDISEALRDGKRQAQATCVTDSAGTILAVATRSIAATLLPQGETIQATLADPPAETGEVQLVLDAEQFYLEHFRPVLELIEAIGTDEPIGDPDVDARAVGAWLPGSNAWLGLDRDIYSGAPTGRTPTQDTAEALRTRWSDVGPNVDLAIGLDGHIMLLRRPARPNEPPPGVDLGNPFGEII